MEVRDGIVKHSKGQGEVIPVDRALLPVTLEGQIVRLADIIAYVNHDIDDAKRAGIIADSDIPESSRKLLGNNYAKRIDTIVIDVIEASLKNDLEFIRASRPVYRRDSSSCGNFFLKVFTSAPKGRSKRIKYARSSWPSMPGSAATRRPMSTPTRKRTPSRCGSSTSSPA